MKRVLLLFTLCLLAGRANALFQGTETEPRDWLVKADYFIDILSYLPRPLYDEVWERSRSGYRNYSGSTQNNELFVAEQFRLTAPLGPHSVFRIQFESGEDFDEKYQRIAAEWMVPLNRSWAIGLHGESRARKEHGDIGAGLMWRGARPETWAKLAVTSVDNWFTDKNDEQAAIEGHGNRIWNARLTGGFGLGRNGRAWFDLETEPGFTIRYPLRDYRFDMEKTRLAAGAVWNVTGLTRAKRPALIRLRYLHERTTKDIDTFSALDPQRSMLERRFDELQIDFELPLRGGYGPAPFPRAAWLGSHVGIDAWPGPLPWPDRDADASTEPERTVRFGAYAAILDEHTRYPNDAARNLFLDHRDFILFAGYIHGITTRWNIDLMLLAGPVDFRRQTGSSVKASDRIQSKLGAGVEYIFAPNARLVVNMTQHLDDGTFGGGNVRLLITF